jgi:hypothetical protein
MIGLSRIQRAEMAMACPYIERGQSDVHASELQYSGLL